MACVDDGSNVPISPLPVTSSNFGSISGSGLDLDGMGHRSYDAHFKELRDMVVPLVRNVASYESHIQTISNSVVLLTSRITNIEQIVSTFSTKMVAFAEMEQNFSSLTARMCKIETSAASASSVSGSARSWPLPGQVDGSIAAGSHGPGSSEEGRNTRRTLGTFSTQMMKMLEVPSSLSVVFLYFVHRQTQLSCTIHSLTSVCGHLIWIK